MRRLFLIPLLIAILGACGGEGDKATESSVSGNVADHNAADVSFAQSMVPHHEEAVRMATMALAKASAPEIKALAQKIIEAQKPEIETLNGWLRQWGETVPPMDGGHGGMSGMSAADVSALEAATGDEFDHLFLEQMVKHHRSAVEMAEKESQEGRHEPAKEMAGRIVETQQAEISEMERMLAS